MQAHPNLTSCHVDQQLWIKWSSQTNIWTNRMQYGKNSISIKKRTCLTQKRKGKKVLKKKQECLFWNDWLRSMTHIQNDVSRGSIGESRDMEDNSASKHAPASKNPAASKFPWHVRDRCPRLGRGIPRDWQFPQDGGFLQPQGILQHRHGRVPPKIKPTRDPTATSTLGRARLWT